MDILSSQANLAGYKAVVEAFQIYERAIPMMMTAAGTIPAAKVLVVGQELQVCNNCNSQRNGGCCICN